MRPHSWTSSRGFEEKWPALRSNAVGVEHLGLYDIPWVSFENVRCVWDITEERVLAFVCHRCPLHEHLVSMVGVPAEGRPNPSARTCCAGTRTDSTGAFLNRLSKANAR